MRWGCSSPLTLPSQDLDCTAGAGRADCAVADPDRRGGQRLATPIRRRLRPTACCRAGACASGAWAAVVCTLLALVLPMHSLEPLLLLSSVFVPFGVIGAPGVWRRHHGRIAARRQGTRSPLPSIGGHRVLPPVAKVGPALGSALPTLAPSFVLASRNPSTPLNGPRHGYTVVPAWAALGLPKMAQKSFVDSFQDPAHCPGPGDASQGGSDPPWAGHRALSGRQEDLRACKGLALYQYKTCPSASRFTRNAPPVLTVAKVDAQPKVPDRGCTGAASYGQAKVPCGLEDHGQNGQQPLDLRLQRNHQPCSQFGTVTRGHSGDGRNQTWPVSPDRLPGCASGA